VNPPFGNEARLSVPGPGRTLQFSVVPWTEPLLVAFESLVSAARGEQLQQEIVTRYCLTFSPAMPIGDDDCIPTAEAVRLASSAVLSMWMLARMAQTDNSAISFSDAEDWFLGNSASRIPGIVGCKGEWPPEDCVQSLSTLSFGWEFEDLLPYILEAFQIHPHSANGLTTSSRHIIHAEKRRHGVFYTPSDVAEFIVEQTLQPWINDKMQDEVLLPDLNCLDPACGTGVFLLAVLTVFAAEHTDSGEDHSPLHTAVQSLYGIDKSRQAIQSCVFAILSRCLEQVSTLGISPWRAWQAIRGNFAVMDSTLVVGRGVAESPQQLLQRQHRVRIREQLLDSSAADYPVPSDCESPAEGWAVERHWSLGGWLEKGSEPRHLVDLFEECAEGFSVVVGNPPYMSIPHDGLQAIRRNLFVSAPASDKARTGNIYTFFVEMMWCFTRPDYARAGMVLPLSLAYHSGRCFRALRDAIEKSGARWRFSFFDRTPDSLFGDAVKTRNAVALVEFQRDGETTIETGPLQRWNSRNRSSLFAELKHIPLRQASIRELIPKLGTPMEATVYELLKKRKEKLGTLWRDLSTSVLTPKLAGGRYVFYYSTAYNWLPVFRHIPMPSDSSDPSLVPASLRGLVCDRVADAEFVFAVVSSRLAYWLWRVEGDGFHLNRRFLAKLPVHSSLFPQMAFQDLTTLANDLWTELLKRPIESINAGRQTLNYSPHECGEILDEIDRILVDVLGLPSGFDSFLRGFVTETIVAGRHEELEGNSTSKRFAMQGGE
jgi:hypothetical protein